MKPAAQSIIGIPVKIQGKSGKMYDGRTAWFPTMDFPGIELVVDGFRVYVEYSEKALRDGIASGKPFRY